MEVKHVALQGSGGISYSLLYRDLKAAQWYGITPDAFTELDRGERANIVAMYEADWRIKALQQYEEQHRARPRGGKR